MEAHQNGKLFYTNTHFNGNVIDQWSVRIAPHVFRTHVAYQLQNLTIVVWNTVLGPLLFF